MSSSSAQRQWRLPTDAQAADVYPKAVWSVSSDGNDAQSQVFDGCGWRASGALWVSGYVRRDVAVAYMSLSDSQVNERGFGATDTLPFVLAASATAAILLARARGSERTVWPVAFVVPLTDPRDGSVLSAAFHCAAPSSRCVAALARVTAPAAMLRFVDRLALLVAHAGTACSFAGAVDCLRRDGDLRRLVAEHTDASLLKASAGVPFLDAPLTDGGGLLTCIGAAELVRLLALLAVFKDDALQFTARVVVHGTDVRQVGVVLLQLLALTQPLLPFAGSFGLCVDDDALAKALGLSWPGLFGMPSWFFATARAVLRRTANSDAEVDATLADLVVLDLDARTLAIPARFAPLTLLPDGEQLAAQIAAAVRGDAGAAAARDSLSKTRTVQVLIKQHVQRVLETSMLVDKYIDVEAGAFASDKFCAEQTDGLLARFRAGSPFRRALAHSPLLREHYVMREIIAPYLVRLMEAGDSASFRVLWIKLNDQAKQTIYATQLREDRVTLLHLAYEYFQAGNAQEYAKTTTFVDVLVNWTHGTKLNPLKALDLQERMPLYYLCRARPGAQLREHADKLRLLLADPAPAGSKVDNPVQLLSSPFYALYRAWDNVSLLMSAVKSGDEALTLVLLEALDRLPSSLALELVLATTYSGGMSALHDACAKDGNAGAVKAILARLRQWSVASSVDADERVLAALGAAREIDGRTPLHTACRLKHAAVLNEMLAQLSIARQSHADAANELLMRRSNPDARGLNNATALQDCCEAVDAIQQFLGAPAPAKNKD